MDGAEQKGCLCGRSGLRKGDVGYIQCDTCHRWLHLKCCGLSQEEADSKSSYHCLACTCNGMRSMPMLQKTRCVLVVVPDPILNQWSHEVGKHFLTSALKVKNYQGCDPRNLRKIGVTSFKDYSPGFAGADVLLMSLRTIQSEFHLANVFPQGEQPETKTAH